MAVLLRCLVLAAAALLAVHAAPAAAQSGIDDAERATVRVAVIAETPSGRSLYGTGSGFLVAPNLVVTNAHVVADARRQPMLGVAVVPPDGEGLIAARIIRYSALMDLALLEFRGGPTMPAALISTFEPRPGDAIVALGYPDIDDLQRPAVELVRPTPPSRTSGSIASLRDRAPTGDPIPTINHEAAISSGSSGGPLIDECGRVIGVNTWHARGAETGEDRGVASRASLLVQFLEEAGVSPRLTDERCLSVAERAEAERQATVKALEVQNRALAAKLDAAERLTSIAVFILIGGTLALLASIGVLGAILLSRRGPRAPKRGAGGPSMLDLDARAAGAAPNADSSAAPNQPAAQASRTGGMGVAIVVAISALAAFMVTAAAVWLLHARAPQEDRAPERFTGEIACTFDAAASNQPGEDTGFTASGALCINERTLYARAPDGVRFQRALLSREAQAIDILTIDPESGEFKRESYALSDTAYGAAAQAAGELNVEGCGGGASAREAVARRTETLSRFVEGRAANRHVWRCAMAAN